jgi:UDP-N-acetylmuramyl pentapeptide phosphotransferase/UDP-N-acetylglucosamine-1-phosphate transferase/glycosyltransferase involved in cell wall biosynthesis
MWTLLIFFALSFAFCLGLTPLLRSLARRCGPPTTCNQSRKLPGQSIPAIGGIVVLLASLAAIVLALLAGLCPWGDEFFGQSVQWLGLAGGAIVISCVGIFKGRLRFRHEILGQILAIAIVISTGLVVKSIDVVGQDLGILAIPVTALFLLGAINSLKLLDGMDGLLSTVALITTVAFACMAAMKDQWATACVAVAMAGALLGFLRYNIPRMTIYLGDSGSMLVGLIIGSLAIKSSLKASATVALLAPVAILAIPILDALATIFRRQLSGGNIYSTDRGLLHQCLLRLGFSKLIVLTLVSSFCLLAVAGAYLSIVLNSEWLARGAAVTVLIILIGMRWFGNGEMPGASRLKGLAVTLLKVRRPVGPLQDGRAWEDLWAVLVRSAEEMELNSIRLEVNSPVLQQNYQSRWVNPRSQDAESGDASWSVVIPLIWQGQTAGCLEVTGGRHDLPVWKKVATFTLLAGELEEILQKIAEAAGISARSADDAGRRNDESAIRKRLNEETSHAAAAMDAKKLHVLVFNRSYYPDVEATGQLLTDLCTDLAAGHSIHVVSGQPNFVRTDAGGLIEKDRHKGVTVTRVRNFKFSKKNLSGRIFGLLSYLVMATWVGLRSRRPDVIVVETDPPILCVLGVLLSRWHRCPFIYYLQDLYPEVGLALGRLRPGIMTRVLYWATQIGLRGADRIIVLGEDMRAKVVSRGIAVEKTTIVPNWADTDLIFPRPRTNPWKKASGVSNWVYRTDSLESGVNGHARNGEMPLDEDAGDSLIVMYSGNLGLSQNLEHLLEAASELRDSPIRFVIVGDGAQKHQLLAQAHTLNLTNVRFFSYQAKEKLGEFLTAADLHFIPLRRGLAGAIVPSKLYGILAAGVPFIAAVDDDSEVARVAMETGAGLVIPPDSVVDLAATLVWCLENRASLPAMGMRGRHAAEKRFSRPVCVRKFERVIAEVTMTACSASRISGPVLSTMATGPIDNLTVDQVSHRTASTMATDAVNS